MRKNSLYKKIKHIGLSFCVYSMSVFFAPLYCNAIEQLRGSWENYPPYQYINRESNKLEGIDINIAQIVFKKMGVNSEFTPTRWNAAVKRIENGSLDFVMGASRTNDREVFALFSIPYRNEEWSLFVRKHERHIYNFKKLEDMLDSNFRLGISEGYYYGEDIMKFIYKMKKVKNKIQIVSNNYNHYRMLFKYRTDGFLNDTIVVSYEIKKQKTYKEFILKHPLVLPATRPVCFMFSKKNINFSFVEKFNAVLADIIKSGECTKILMKYTE